MENRKKLKSIGIETPQDLMKITGRKYTLCRGIIGDRIPISKGVALKIKEFTGASLDFILR